MKKLFVLIITAVMLTATFLGSSLSVCAETNGETNEKIIFETTKYFDDGCSLLIILTEETTALMRTSTYSKSGSKHYVFYNEDKVELWRFSVHGTFKIDPGISSTCTADSYSINISDDTWQNESVSTYKSGNQAIGDAIFIQKYLFITISTQNCHVVLTCDINGNLS